MRLIDADKLIEDAELCYVKMGARSNGKSILTLAKTWLLKEVDSAPTIEAKPVVHAHWVDKGWAGMICSNCGKNAIEGHYDYQVLSAFCPFCGAQMDEVVEK